MDCTWQVGSCQSCTDSSVEPASTVQASTAHADLSVSNMAGLISKRTTVHVIGGVILSVTKPSVTRCDTTVEVALCVCVSDLVSVSVLL